MIRYSIAQTSLGPVIVGMSPRGLCAIEPGDDETTLPERLKADFPDTTIREAGAELAPVLEQVVRFLDQPGIDLDIPLDMQGSEFQLRVWQLLRAIPAGTTLSYTDLAERLGSPGSARAVAGACAANRLAVAIPCHRIIRRDGGLSGYRWGLERKRALLEREAVQLAATA
ncbi:ADA regulatory protein [Marinobacter santoriniensis NKSG1]|uniref:methylated-DNA--[protein]-cysteine S-methyltransferase n=1 Tax=Marinobacter santoriniensis NKSG1 TaxID=1288826 RepID=M7DFZ6_9GAMM|nr:methylated-DNA--[protein]-cysteine S-methyltransferase [Marinobacter santoriniensis]EMP56592.1 ADA regulatory protein [Marinobacter santoriniensis NKSG1]